MGLEVYGARDKVRESLSLVIGGLELRLGHAVYGLCSEINGEPRMALEKESGVV